MLKRYDLLLCLLSPNRCVQNWKGHTIVVCDLESLVKLGATDKDVYRRDDFTPPSSPEKSAQQASTSSANATETAAPAAPEQTATSSDNATAASDPSPPHTPVKRAAPSSSNNAITLFKPVDEQ